MTAQQKMNWEQAQYNIKEELAAMKVQFIEGLVADLKEFGKANYHIEDKDETLTMSHVVEHMDCDIDEPIKLFFMVPKGNELQAVRFHNAINEAALGLAGLIAERVFK